MTTLREHTEPALADAGRFSSVTDLLEARAATAPDHIAFDVRDPDAAPGTGFAPVTTEEFRTRVRAVAKGLIAWGIRPGDHIAIVSRTRYEWTVADLAAMYAGAVVVPMFDTAPETQMQAIADAVDIRLAFADGAELASVLERVVGEPVWRLDAALGSDLDALAASGRHISDEELDAQRRARGLDDVATIVFTSGTTGAPKGAKIRHRSFIHQVLNVAGAYREIVRSGGSTVLFLPLAHVLARGLQMICLHQGMRVAHVADPKKAVASLRELSPTFLVVVPRVLQKVAEAAAANAERLGVGALWLRAVGVAQAVGAHRLGEPGAASLSARTLLAHRLFDAVFFRRLRALLGGRIGYLLSGAAPLDPDLVRFFAGCGIPVVEGYGLTETTAPACGNRPGDIVPGSVGLPLPGMSVRIDEGGEVLVRGPGVFAGYTDAEETAAAFDGDWLRTGDLGVLDDSGRLTVTGRMKDVVVTSGGKTINPAAWEREVEAHPAVGHAVVLGDGLAHPTAMILLDHEALPAWAQKTMPAWQIPQAAGHLIEITEEAVRESIHRAVEAANARVPGPEQLRSFTVLLPDAADLARLLTPTQKLKRSALAEQIAHLLRDR